MYDAPVIIDASSPTRKDTSAATSSGSTIRLIALGQQHLLEHLGLVDAVDARLIGDLLLHEGCSHVAGVDAVAADAPLGAFESGDLRQSLQRVLRRDVRRLVGRCPDAVHGRHVDDASVPGLVHVRQSGTHQQERCLHHECQDAAEHHRVEVLDRRHVLDSRVVHQDVGLEGEVRERVDVGEIHLPRVSPISCASAVAASPSRSATVTRAPFAARARAIAAPIPLAPPVMRADRPVRSVMVTSLCPSRSVFNDDLRTRFLHKCRLDP